MQKLTTRGYSTAKAISRHEEFDTHGALYARTDPCGIGSGRLNQAEAAQFWTDRPDIVYVVVSYATPIAWVTRSGRVHRVAQKFSVTTTKHQGRLYLLAAQVGNKPQTPSV